ncbi:MAG: AMP-binding protein [Pseudomonadota bacterium]
MWRMNLGGALARSAAKYPAKEAVRDQSGGLTYAVFNRRVNRLAHGLRGLGLEKGQRLATLSPNCLELMELFFACLKLGVVPCPLDTRATLADHQGMLALVDPRGLAFHPGQAARAAELRAGLERDALAIALAEQGLAGAPAVAELLGGESEVCAEVDVVEDDLAFILFTGGTTGTPKGVELTHANLIWNAINVIAENRSPSPEARICYPMQIYHSGALSRFLATIFAGGTFIGLAKFEAADYLDALEREGGTFVVGNQAIWQMLLGENAKRRRRLESVTGWLHAQGDITVEMREQIGAELFPNAGMYASYALTEASPGVTVLKPADRPQEWPSLGRGYMSLEVRVADPEDRPLPVGQVGQILVRGPNVMRGYHRDPQATAQALAGGWLHTGDLARADEQGFLYFADRLKDMIKSGGLNVYTREVEEVIARHPRVAEVAVIGVPHPRWGESVRAVVVPTPGPVVAPREIIEFCRDRLAGYKKPTSVVFTDGLPKDSFGGKVKRNLLRARFGQPEPETTHNGD